MPIKKQTGPKPKVLADPLDSFRESLGGVDVPDDILAEAAGQIDPNFKPVPAAPLAPKRDPLELLRMPAVLSRLEPSARALTTISQLAFPMFGAPLKTKDTERIEKDIASGFLASAGGTVGAYPAAEVFFEIDTPIGRTAKKMADSITKISAQLAPHDPNFIDQTAMGIGSMALFMPAGVVGGLAASGTMRLGTFAVRLAPLVGTGISTILESAAESGSVFMDAEKKPGWNKRKAADAAFETFWKNMILIGITNRYGLFGETGGKVARLIKSSSMEGIQEGAQEIISSVAKKESVNWKAVVDSAGVGAIVGGGAKGIMDLASADMPVTKVDAAVVGGPEAVAQFRQNLPILAESILGKDFPVSPAAIQEGLQHAGVALEAAIKGGQDPADAQLTAAKAFADRLDLETRNQPQNPKTPERLQMVDALESLEPLVTEESIVSPETKEVVKEEKKGQPAAQEGQGEALSGLVESLDLEPFELRYDQYKRVYGEGRPDAEIQSDYRKEIRAAIKTGKDVPNAIIDSLPEESAADWKMGNKRSFAFDPNSTQNEGRFRLYPQNELTDYFRRKSSTPGVSYVIGKDQAGNEVVQAIRFDKGIMPEQKAGQWWEDNKSRFEFFGTEPVKKPIPPTMRLDRRGIPIRNPEDVVARIPSGQGRPVKITHQMVLDEAQGLLDEAEELL